MIYFLFAPLCWGALTIPSEYENFVEQIRSRVVIHASDLVDKNSTSCRSIDGPCALYRKQPGSAFSMIDSVVSLKLFSTEPLKNAASESVNNFLNTYTIKDIPKTEGFRKRINFNEAAFSFREPGKVSKKEFIYEQKNGQSTKWQGILKERRHPETKSRIGLIGNKFLRIKFDGDGVLLRSLKIAGKAFARAHHSQKLVWRSETYAPVHCKVGSYVYFPSSELATYSAQAFNGRLTGSILFREDKIAYVLARDTVVPIAIENLVTINGLSCADRVDIEYASIPDPVTGQLPAHEMVLRAAHKLDTVDIWSEGEFEITHVEYMWSKETVKDLTYLVVYPSHQMSEIKLSPLAPLVTVNQMDLSNLMLPATTIYMPEVSDDWQPIPLMESRNFDHVLRSLERGIIIPFPFGPSQAEGQKKLKEELEDLLKTMKRNQPSQLSNHVHWDTYFTWLVETQGYPHLAYYIEKIPNPDVHVPIKKKMVLNGQYSCLQGSTVLNVEFEQANDDLSTVVGEFQFTANNGKVKGAYMISGERTGSVLTMKPTPDGWISRPQGFYPVGLTGALYQDPDYGIVWEGTIPHPGCNDFRVTLHTKQAKKKVTKTQPFQEIVANFRRARWNFRPDEREKEKKISIEFRKEWGLENDEVLKKLADMLVQQVG